MKSRIIIQFTGYNRETAFEHTNKFLVNAGWNLLAKKKYENVTLATFTK